MSEYNSKEFAMEQAMRPLERLSLMRSAGSGTLSFALESLAAGTAKQPMA